MEFVDPIYDKKDLPRMRKAIKQQVNGERNLLLFELGLNTALRPSDLLSMKVKDVKNGIVRMRASKTKKALEIRLNDHVFMLVRAYINEMEDDDLLFPINRTTAYRFLKKAAKDIGLEENIGAHSLRKTKAYHLYVDSGYDIGLIMNLLQHDKAGSTLHYIGWSKEVFEEKLKEHVI
ncbi:tyrosine-type recombinase/integrase [Priestia megaterium]|uniref:tyrosine-type recombinase/integrase n=1 Tax=Priestia megaterium TaxID=1404 RepID=UPI0034D46406